MKNASAPAVQGFSTFRTPAASGCQPEKSACSLQLLQAIHGYQLDFMISQSVFMLPWFREKIGIESCPKDYLKQVWVSPGQPSTIRRLTVHGTHRKRRAKSAEITPALAVKGIMEPSTPAAVGCRPAKIAGSRQSLQAMRPVRPIHFMPCRTIRLSLDRPAFPSSRGGLALVATAALLCLNHSGPLNHGRAADRRHIRIPTSIRKPMRILEGSPVWYLTGEVTPEAISLPPSGVHSAVGGVGAA